MVWLTSGIAGLLFGSVLGLFLSVAFEDPLKKGLAAGATRMRRAWSRGALPTVRYEFSLGALKTHVLVVEGDGEQVIDEQAVRVLVEHRRVRLPPDLERWRDEIADEQAARKEAGLAAHWNGPTYAVAGLSISRHGIDEAPTASLRLCESDYFTFLATQQLDRVLPDGSTLRATYLESQPPDAIPEFMSSGFGVYVAVVTADDQIVFARRSQQVGVFAGCWDVPVNEAVSRSLDSHGRTPPSLYAVARRGLQEEASIFPDECRLDLLAFDVDRASNQWGCMFLARLYELRGADVVDRLSRGVPDRWEHDGLEIVQFDVASVVHHLLRPDRLTTWTPTAPPLAYLALVQQFGRAHVEQETSKALRNLQ